MSARLVRRRRARGEVVDHSTAHSRVSLGDLNTESCQPELLPPPGGPWTYSHLILLSLRLSLSSLFLCASWCQLLAWKP